MLGGVLADQTSYSSTFLYTAALQFVGVLFQASLMWVVPRKEKKSGEPEGLEKPLLDAAE